MKRGDSLYAVFRKHKVSLGDLERVVRTSSETRGLREVKAGHRLEIVTTTDQGVAMLRYAVDTKSDLLVTRSGEGFTAARLQADKSWRQRKLGEMRVAAPARTARSAKSSVATSKVQAVSTATAASTVPPATSPQAPTAVLQTTGLAQAPLAADTAPSTPAVRTFRVKIATGDNLFDIFKRLKLDHTVLHTMSNTTQHRGVLAKLRPGQRIEIESPTAGKVYKVTVHKDAVTRFEFLRSANGFVSRQHDAKLTRRVSTARGYVKSSLYEAGLEAGLDDRLIMQMVNMFSWDIDFALDIRTGDAFSVIYEEYLLDGKRVRQSNLLAAEFVNSGRAVRGVRFEETPGHGQFYAPDGMSMRKAFLRTPVNFTRISSRFSKRRFHPVLHRFRAHKGVDYAAPTGTPVKAAGDGRVTFAGRKRGYGKTVILQHGAKYSTLYAHLHTIPRGIKAGKRVRQGQRIGTVGSTGLATGPHLHYEFRVNNKHMDPLKVTLPRALPLDKKLHKRFKAETGPLLARLDELSRLRVAMR